ncbi:MAG TPA: small basic protein [Candidatus Hypogeohydataceae bacterium YC38]|nr:small basic protein [Candidatus Brocadiales bacterium]
MTIDKSLAIKGKLARARSILSRVERVKLLEAKGEWKSGDSVFGLPKVKVAKVRKRPKAEKEAPKEAAAVTPVAGAEAEVKAEKGKPSKPTPSKEA